MASLQQSSYFRVFGERLNHANVWSKDRDSIAKGVASGLLVCFLPLPGQAFLAALFVYLWRGNLPIAILSTWLSNPFTFIPINFAIYKIGDWIAGAKVLLPNTFPTLTWHLESLPAFLQESATWFSLLGKAYLIGLLVMSFSTAVLAYVIIQLGWRVATYWQKRHSAHQ